MFKTFIVAFITFFCFDNAFSRCDIQLNKMKLCANVTFKISPNKKRSSDFKLEFYSPKDKKNILPKEVHSYLWMKMDGSEGHGSDPINLTQSKSGYDATNVWFLMEGTWQLFVQIKKDNKVVDQGYKEFCIAGRKVKCK